ncbi:MAG: porin family protein [Alphaproteobacteria bacterium]|nr:porin family protein [Alphaproteobacteria bacterium]
MVKSKIALVALVSSIAFSANVNNANAGLLGEFYLGGSIHSADTDNNDKSDSGYSVAFGWELPIPVLDIRAEIEYNKMGDAKDNNDVEYESIMANAYIDIPFPTPLLSPYVGAGVGKITDGTVNVGGPVGDVELEEDGIGYQYMVGLDINIPATPFYTSLEYRKIVNPFTVEGGIGEDDLEQDVVSLKARYVF